MSYLFAIEREYTAQQRAAVVMVPLMRGEKLRTVDVAKLTGLSWTAAMRMMEGLSGAVPLYRDDDGYWRMC